MELDVAVERVADLVDPAGAVRLVGYPDAVSVAVLNDDRIVFPVRAASEAAIYATFPSAETRPIFPELMSEGLEPHKVSELWLMFSEKSNTFIDITATIDRKIESLSKHVSQIGGQNLDFVRKWNAETGKEAGYAYAESYRVLRLVQPEQSEATIITSE